MFEYWHLNAQNYMDFGFESSKMIASGYRD